MLTRQLAHKFVGKEVLSYANGMSVCSSDLLAVFTAQMLAVT